MKKFVKWWLPVVVWLIVIFVGSSIGDVPQIGDDATDGLVHRAAHVLEFAVLGALTLRATAHERPITKRHFISALLVVVLYGVSDEFHQRFTPGRSSEGSTVLFDVAGGLIGAWVWRWWASTDRQRISEAASRRDGESTNQRVSEAVGQRANEP